MMVTVFLEDQAQQARRMEMARSTTPLPETCNRYASWLMGPCSRCVREPHQTHVRQDLLGLQRTLLAGRGGKGESPAPQATRRPPHGLHAGGCRGACRQQICGSCPRFAARRAETAWDNEMLSNSARLRRPGAVCLSKGIPGPRTPYEATLAQFQLLGEAQTTGTASNTARGSGFGRAFWLSMHSTVFSSFKSGNAPLKAENGQVLVSCATSFRHLLDRLDSDTIRLLTPSSWWLCLHSCKHLSAARLPCLTSPALHMTWTALLGSYCLLRGLALCAPRVRPCKPCHAGQLVTVASIRLPASRS